MSDEETAGALVRAKTYNKFVESVRHVKSIRGENGVNVVTGGDETVISLASNRNSDSGGDGADGEWFDLWVCDLTDPLNPTPVQRKFWVEKETP